MVIPQLVARAEFLDQIMAVAAAAAASARYHEIALMDIKENALRRFEARTETSTDTQPVTGVANGDVPAEPYALFDVLHRR